MLGYIGSSQDYFGSQEVIVSYSRSFEFDGWDMDSYRSNFRSMDGPWVEIGAILGRWVSVGRQF